MVVVVDVLVHPIPSPFDAQSVVHIVAEHHQPAVRWALVEVEVVLVADVVVPMSDEDFDSGQFEKGVDVEDGFKLTLEVRIARRPYGVAQITNRRIVIGSFVGFQLIGSLFAVPRGCEFVRFGVVPKVSEVCGIRALPQIPVVVFEALFEEFFIHVLHVDVQSPVFLVDVQPNMADARGNVTVIPHVFPNHPRPQHGGVIVVSVEVELFQPIPFATRGESVEADLEALFCRCA